MAKEMKQRAGRGEHVDVRVQIAAHPACLKDLRDQADRPVLEGEHASRHASRRVAAGAQRDHGQVRRLGQQLVLGVEEIAHALTRRRSPSIPRAEARPSLLLEIGELQAGLSDVQNPVQRQVKRDLDKFTASVAEAVKENNDRNDRLGALVGDSDTEEEDADGEALDGEEIEEEEEE